MKQMAMDGDAPFLPQEIITNILKRLPVKSLIRFQCVCKHWKNLIKTPSFIADHFHHSSNQNPFLLLQCDGRCDPLHLHMLDCEMRVREVQASLLIDSSSLVNIVGCSNGMLCLRIKSKGISSPSILLWNPAIREIRQVPRTINNLGDDFSLGFGFSPIVNDYKIVISHERQFDNDEFNRVEVYSLRTGSWKQIELGNSMGVRLHPLTVTANGAIFCYGNKLLSEDEDNCEWVIISFDIAMEEFTLTPMPPINSDSYDWLTVYENKLAMFSRTWIQNHESLVIDLWVMEEGIGASGERSSWSKKYSISTCSGYLSPFSIWGNEIVCNVKYVPESSRETEGEANNGMITVLSLLNLTTHELGHVDIRRCGNHLDGFLNYSESLVPVGNVQAE